MGLRLRAIMPLICAVAFALTGCQSTGAEASGSSGTDGATASGAEAYGDPLGYCGQKKHQGEDIGVYLTGKIATCEEALDLAERAKEGPQGTRTEGYPQFGSWRCAYVGREQFRVAVVAACWQGQTEEASVLLRPADIETMPGFQRSPLDFGAGYRHVHFKTPSGDFLCAMQDAQLGCDAVNGKLPDAPTIEDPLTREENPASTLVLPRDEPAKFEHHEDPAYGKLAPKGYGTDTEVLDYGEVLHFDGYSCTADRTRDVVCRRGEHGFELSKQAMKTY